MKSCYYNPDPLFRLLGETNETKIKLDGTEMRALVDSGSQISTVTEKLAKLMGWKIKNLKNILDIEGTGGVTVRYKGYIKATLEIPQIKDLEKPSLFVVVNDSKYGEQVPVQIGPLHIDLILKRATPGEIAELGKAWERGSVARNKFTKVGEFMIDQVKGPVKAAEYVVLQPGETKKISGMAQFKGNSQRINLVTEPINENQKIEDLRWVTIPSYTECKGGSSRVGVATRNLSKKLVVISKGQHIANVTAANQVPNMLAPKYVEKWSYDKAYDNSKEELSVLQQSYNRTDKAQIKKLWDQLDISGTDSWKEDQRQLVRETIEHFEDVFALGPLELGKTSLVRHTIKVTNPNPFKERYRRIPPHQFEEVQKHLKEMEDIGAIRRSNSPWASPVVLVKKKDSSLRFCIDLRKLNARTIKDAYSLPRIEESLDCLNGATIFTSLDLKSGYWQVELDDESVPLTAFTVGPLGFYECIRMPFGLMNAPATFQRLMESCLGEMHLNWCIIYLDNVIIFSSTPEEHIQHLRGVLQKLRAAGLKLKPSKCEFFKDRISYLGHIVSKNGVETDPKKVKVIQDWPILETVYDVRSFLGFMNYYRKFLFRYSRIVKPLNKLISGENSKKKKGPVKWEEKHQEAFEKLKQLCTEAPILAYVDYKKPFRVYTDASEIGLGAVISQVQNEIEHVIAYASRSLNKAERRYIAHKLEFLALKWAVTDRFHEYLYGREFEVFTDNNPLTYILTSAKLDATGQRWVAALGLYDFQIHYSSGKKNANADALSRIPWDRESRQEVTKMDAISVKATMTKAEDKCIPQAKENVVSFASQFYAPKMSPNEWRVEQEKDPAIKKIIDLEEKGSLFNYRSSRDENPDVQNYLKVRKSLCMTGGLLYRKVQLKHHQEVVKQLVLPSKFRKRVVLACHDEMGNLGMDRTLLLLQDRVYWPGMSRDVHEHIRTCGRCERFKDRPNKEEIEQTDAHYPLELIHVDFLTIGGKKDARKDINVLVVTDHFTRYAQAYVTTSQTAITVARVLFTQYFTHYGWPTKLITDQGSQFEGKLFKHLMAEANVRKIRTTPYHPEGNAQCERFNRTLLGMLGTMPIESKGEWQEWVSAMTHAYNCTISKTTGFSPYHLMYGREPKIPIDVELNLPSNREEITPRTYMDRLIHKMEWAFEKAKENIAKDKVSRKKYHDKTVRCHRVEVGDLVLLRDKNLKSNYKIADKWEDGVYEVLSRREEVPVFAIRKLGSKEIHVVHRNMIHPAHSVIRDKEPVGGRVTALSKANLLMDQMFSS